MEVKTDPAVRPIFDQYPDSVREKMLNLRWLILETAEETTGVAEIEETLKWCIAAGLTYHKVKKLPLLGM